MKSPSSEMGYVWSVKMGQATRDTELAIWYWTVSLNVLGGDQLHGFRDHP